MPSMAAARALGARLAGIEVRGEAGRVLLSVPELSLAAGRSVAVRGASGAGKSTFLHVLSGLVRPQAGRVLWNGADLTGLSERARTRFRLDNMGLLFQDFLLFEELGPQENAAICGAFAARSARQATAERARDWLARLGVGGTSARRAENFSGGERQRIAVARALSTDPGILLADEPTASLDRPAADRLIDTLAGLGGARTMVVVTHDAALAARMDRVLTLADGRVVEDSSA